MSAVTFVARVEGCSNRQARDWITQNGVRVDGNTVSLADTFPDGFYVYRRGKGDLTVRLVTVDGSRMSVADPTGYEVFRWDGENVLRQMDEPLRTLNRQNHAAVMANLWIYHEEGLSARLISAVRELAGVPA